MDVGLQNDQINVWSHKKWASKSLHWVTSHIQFLLYLSSITIHQPWQCEHLWHDGITPPYVEVGINTNDIIMFHLHHLGWFLNPPCVCTLCWARLGELNGLNRWTSETSWLPEILLVYLVEQHLCNKEKCFTMTYIAVRNTITYGRNTMEGTFYYLQFQQRTASLSLSFLLHWLPSSMVYVGGVAASSLSETPHDESPIVPLGLLGNWTG